MATYTAKAVETVRATKATKGIVGITLKFSNKSGLRAIVKNTVVPLYMTSDERVSFSSKSFTNYEQASEEYLSRELLSAQKYLDAKYCIRQKSYMFLVELAMQGKALYTKAELKAMEAEKAEEKAC